MSFPAFKVKLNLGFFLPKGGNIFLAPCDMQLGLLFSLSLSLSPIVMKGRWEQPSHFHYLHSFSFTVNNQFYHSKQCTFSKQNQ